MYINNITGKVIKNISFNGYYFSIPIGVSLAWVPFAKFLFKDIYPINGEGGGPLPVVMATASQWKGDRYVDVVRFPMNYELIPARKDLFKLAKSRGIPKVTLDAWEEDESITNEEIVKAINELDVPEEVKYPTAGPDTSDSTDDADAAAEGALNDTPGPKGALSDVQTPTAPAQKPLKAVPSVTRPKTVKASGPAKKAARKAPTTPKSKAAAK